MFYIGVVLLLFLAVLFIAWPVIVRQRAAQAHRAEQDSRASANIALYRDHRQELEKSLTSGSINDEQYQQLKDEMERNLLEDNQCDIKNVPEQQKQSRHYGIIAGMVVCVLVLSGITYDQLGAYKASQLKSVLDQRAELESRYISTGDKSLATKMTVMNHQLTEQLTAYVGKRPEDLQMRVLLARTLMGLGDYPRAIDQFQEVLKREPELAQIMAEMAQAVFLQANNQVVPVVQTLVDKTLQLEPNNTIALGLAGISAFHKQQYQQAIDFWKQAVDLQGAAHPNSIALQNGIQAAQQRLASGPDNTQLSAKRPEKGASSRSTLPAEMEHQVMVTVSLGDQVDFSPEDTVFVYARAWQGARMPLSIARMKARELPTTLALTNAMSMAPGMDLNSTEQLELVARLSKGGGPTPESGDWEVTLGPVTSTAAAVLPYDLVISDQIP